MNIFYYSMTIPNISYTITIHYNIMWGWVKTYYYHIGGINIH